MPKMSRYGERKEGADKMRVQRKVAVELRRHCRIRIQEARNFALLGDLGTPYPIISATTTNSRPPPVYSH
jgi:hypothetical protein